jgi:pimeloyl-ACP methyl ester carboxylesterase
MRQFQFSIRGGAFKTTVDWGGSGPPLVYLHGAAGPNTGAPFLDALAKNFTVYAPATPGFPPATGIEHLDDVQDLALYYHDFLDELGLENPHLVGSSMGGMLAAEITALSPRRIGKLVLVGPAGLWLDAHPIPDFFTFNAETMVEHAFYDSNSELARMMLAQFKDPEIGLVLYQHLSAAAKFLWPIPDRGLRKRLHRIQQPTLIIWGAGDKLIAPVYGEAFHQAIKGSRLLTLPKSGHLPMLEEPEAFVEAVTQFLI